LAGWRRARARSKLLLKLRAQAAPHFLRNYIGHENRILRIWKKSLTPHAGNITNQYAEEFRQGDTPNHDRQPEHCGHSLQYIRNEPAFQKSSILACGPGPRDPDIKDRSAEIRVTRLAIGLEGRGASGRNIARGPQKRALCEVCAGRFPQARFTGELFRWCVRQTPRCFHVPSQELAARVLLELKASSENLPVFSSARIPRGP